jgi:cobalamin biosynthetic protein CobC
MAAAFDYYQTNSLLAVAGSQAAIQALPQLRAPCRVGVPLEGYAEHQYNWQHAGHRVEQLTATSIDSQLAQLDVLVLINPNNPTGQHFSVDQLLDWHQRLAQRGGWLVVDEAFIDCQPQQSLLTHSPRPGLIVLRSVGKFFGLAGIRAGFVAAEPALLTRLQQWLGPWTLGGPTRQVCQQALSDQDWQQRTRQRLTVDQQRLQQLLASTSGKSIMGTELFQTLTIAQASEIYLAFARQGILLRLFEPQSRQPLLQQTKSPFQQQLQQQYQQHPTRSMLRFGLPGTEAGWRRLQAALEILGANNPLSPAHTAMATP